ncbi:hypothetical protein [Trinickia fusca]|nr:hypothetical protein [Trinickia fusca]
MGRKRLRSAWFSLFSSFAAAGAIGATLPGDIPLETPRGFVPVSITPIKAGAYCISGEVVAEAGSATALAMLVDTNKRQVVWRSTIPPAESFVTNEARSCAGSGSSYYVVTEESTSTAVTPSQSVLFIHKLDADGKLVRRQRIDAGFDEWSYLLDVSAERISVVGGDSDSPDRSGTYSTFMAQFDSDLAQTNLVKLPTGAFAPSSVARFDGRYLRVAGPFRPNGPAPTPAACCGYAVSKIDLAKRRYIWSAHPDEPGVESPIAAFGADGSTHYLALDSGKLTAASVDASGRVTNRFSVSKPVCSVEAMDVAGNAFEIVGAACDEPPASVMLSVDFSGQVVSLTRSAGDIVLIAHFDRLGWAAVVDAGDVGDVFRRMGE